MGPSQAAMSCRIASCGQALSEMSMKALPCDDVSSRRSFDGAKALASSAMSRSALSSPVAAARWMCARKTPSRESRRHPTAWPTTNPAARPHRDVTRFHRPLDAAGTKERTDFRKDGDSHVHPADTKPRLSSADNVVGSARPPRCVRRFTCGHEHGNARGDDDRGHDHGRNVRRWT